MDRERWKQLEEAFEAALDTPPAERSPFLDAHCGDDADLRRRVEALIASSDETGSFFDSAIKRVAADALEEPVGAFTGSRFGPYELISELGRGGMGAVYLASRVDDQFSHHVAIKFISEGRCSPELLQRFSSERQILANLNHPNVARLMDGGTTEKGTPYVVMEHVDGRRIDDYCVQEDVDVRRTLELFLEVCSAVQYAHQNLIVHRDLKPANILVTREGVPKLLDFGIAKPLDPELLPQGGAQTRTGMWVMTPEYASPEQLRGQTVTTATDIYSLGVVLYELLTGGRPYELDERRQQDWERQVCELEPERPSTAVRRRGTDDRLRAVGRQLSGDLDNIVLMAMRKEPERRYASVAQLAEDIGRHLEGLPVVARANTMRYRMGKFVRRNRLPVAATVSFALLIVAFGVAMAIQASRVARERDRAELQRGNAQEVSAFLVEIFSVSDPGESQGNDIRAREILDRGARRIRTELTGQPRLQASMMSTIGSVYFNLGLYDPAEELQREALRIHERIGDEQGIAAVQNALGLALKAKSEYEEAEILYRESLDRFRELHVGDHPAVAGALNNLGYLLQAAGKYDEVGPLLNEALAMRRRLGQEDQIATELNNLGMLHLERGDVEAAEPYLVEALELRRHALGDPHPLLALSLGNLGSLAHDRGNYEEAARYYEESLDMNRRLFGDDHETVAFSLNNLALLHEDMGDPNQAERYYRESLELHRRILGDEHESVATVMNNLAAVLRSQGKTDEAEPLYREALEIRIRLFGEEHVTVAISSNSLARLAHDRGDYDTAEQLYLRVRDLLLKLFDDSHPYVATTIGNLGSLSIDRGDYPRAEQQMRQALALHETHRGPEHPQTGAMVYKLGSVLELAGKKEEEARSSYERSLAIARASNPEGSLHIAHPLIGLGRLMVDSGEAEEAEPLLREGLAIRRANLPEAHVEIASAESALGGCLAALDRFDEAETLLLASWANQQAALGPGNRTFEKTRQRLISFYERSGRPVQAAAYRSSARD